MTNLLNSLTNAYIIAMVFSFLVSLRIFRQKGELPLKLFSVLLGIVLIAECTAVYYLKRQHRSTVPLYNVVMLVEFMAYTIFFRMIIHHTILKKIMLAYLLVFPFFWYWVVFERFGLTAWNSYLAITGAVCTI